MQVGTPAAEAALRLLGVLYDDCLESTTFTGSSAQHLQCLARFKSTFELLARGSKIHLLELTWILARTSVQVTTGESPRLPPRVLLWPPTPLPHLQG